VESDCVLLRFKSPDVVRDYVSENVCLSRWGLLLDLKNKNVEGMGASWET